MKVKVKEIFGEGEIETSMKSITVPRFYAGFQFQIKNVYKQPCSPSGDKCTSQLRVIKVSKNVNIIIELFIISRAGVNGDDC